MNLIGLDIGTTSICGVLYSRKDNKTLNVITHDNTFITSSPGEYLQDPDAILQKVKSILDELIDFSIDKVEGISLSSQMHGILYVDNNGQSVSLFYTWQNQRGLKQLGDRYLEKVLSERLKYPVYSGYGIVTHYSILQEKAIPSTARYFCNIGDYVCMKLSGREIPVTDITLGSSMGICNIRTGNTAEILNLLGSECANFLPEIVPSAERLGEYRSIPVIQPIGDNQASFLGSVQEKEKSLLLNYGTAGQISFYSKTYKSYSGFETRPFGNEGYIHAAFSLCGGNAYKLLARFFTEAVSIFSKETSIDSMGIMNKLTLDFSSKSIDCMPLFLGQRGGQNENGYFRNITESNFTPQNLVKALIQGMINELFQYYNDLPEDVKKSMIYLIGAGNGMRKNKHLVHAAKMKYDKPLHLLNQSEESCLGAIINAGKGIGLYPNYGEGTSEIITYNES